MLSTCGHPETGIAGAVSLPGPWVENKTLVLRRQGVHRPKQLEAGPFAADVASFGLHLAAENKAAGTVRTYAEAALWFAAAHRGIRGSRARRAGPPQLRPGHERLTRAGGAPWRLTERATRRRPAYGCRAVGQVHLLGAVATAGGDGARREKRRP